MKKKTDAYSPLHRDISSSFQEMCVSYLTNVTRISWIFVFQTNWIFGDLQGVPEISFFTKIEWMKRHTGIYFTSCSLLNFFETALQCKLQLNVSCHIMDLNPRWRCSVKDVSVCLRRRCIIWALISVWVRKWWVRVCKDELNHFLALSPYMWVIPMLLDGWWVMDVLPF